MFSFPSYSELVITMTSLAFLLCYAATISLQAWQIRGGKGTFVLSQVALALLVALCGSVLSFLTLYLLFGHA